MRNVADRFIRVVSLVVLIGAAGCGAPPPAAGDWPAYLGGPDRNHYSRLEQINAGNVAGLKRVWEFHTGDAESSNRSQIQCNPVVIDGILYGTSPQIKVFALDGTSGRELWRFDPFAGEGGKDSLGVNRGLSYWSDDEDRRILFTAGSYLYCLNAADGRPVPGFGEEGRVDLRQGLDRDIDDLYLIATSPGAVYRDLLILGSRVGEGPGTAAPGHIRAFNIRTGKQVWIFHTIPQPGEFGYETWPKDAWRRVGGANSWSGMSVDRERGIVFVPTGSAAFDFWGGNRKGSNLFANCLLALDATTGKRIWHEQLVHHDLWDRDLPAPPNLVTLERDGSSVDAVAQITKAGQVFVFNRETGKPLFPIEEVPVPASDLRGEEAWPTQPRPLLPPPFARQSFTESDATDRSPEANRAVVERLRQVRTGRQFIPPSTEGTVIFPGFDGGGEWGGAAFDPKAGTLFVNASEMPWILTMVDLEAERQKKSHGGELYAIHCGVCHGTERQGDPEKTFPPLTALHGKYTQTELKGFIRQGKGFMPAFAQLPAPDLDALAAYLLDPDAADSGDGQGRTEKLEVPYSHTGYNRFLDPDGYPAVRPPWGTLTALDLNHGRVLWQVPLGEYPELAAQGLPPTGTENYGGPLVTAGGLVFIAASRDEKFRAFDGRTGRMLWETTLPAGGYATPCTYRAEGRQFVVIAAGGGKMGTPSGDAYVVFALPR